MNKLYNNGIFTGRNKMFRLIDSPIQNENGELIIETKIVMERGIIIGDHGKDFLTKGVEKFDSKHYLPDNLIDLRKAAEE